MGIYATADGNRLVFSEAKSLPIPYYAEEPNRFSLICLKILLLKPRISIIRCAKILKKGFTSWELCDIIFLAHARFSDSGVSLL